MEDVTTDMHGRCGRAARALGLVVLGAAASVGSSALAQEAAPAATLPAVESVGIAPLPGSGLPRDRVPGNPRSFSSPDIARDGRLLGGGLSETLERGSASVTRNDTGSNPFQPDVQIRGFSASPLLGTPQGVAVYQNGVRINEAFGDTVNWDLIPEIAIRDLDVLSGGSPLFGLNAIGGAIALRMRTGFDFQGAEADLGFGSYGRRALGLHAGRQAGNAAAYFAVEGLDDDGYRRFSPSRVRRLYGDVGFRGERATLHFSIGHGSNHLSGNGPAPVDLLRQGRREVFTYPDKTRNRLLTFQARGTYAVTDWLSLETTAYIREFRQRTLNGDLAEVEECEDAALAGQLCLDGADESLTAPDGTPLPAALLRGRQAGAVNRTRTNSTGAGVTTQAVSTAPLFGLPLRAVVGASYDRGDTQFDGSSELGAITPDRTVAPSGFFINQAENGIATVRLRSTNQYVGLYGSATLDLTPRLSATVGGRWNYAEIDLRDRLGTALNGTSDFSRFNPAAGLTWRFLQNTTAYFGYSEANRAPSPAELSCADPLLPCPLGAFFLADPPLKQVVSRTFELGVRGSAGTDRLGFDGRLRWNIGLFRTSLEDDILLVQSDIQGRGFFQNAGDTRRQGVEAGLSWRNERVAVGLDYALIDATFRAGQRLPSPNNLFADEDGAILVERGDRLPGIPRHRLRFDAEWRPIPAWTVGGNVVYNSGQYLRGDEGNQAGKLDGYALVNLRTSLRVGPGVELYGLIRNLFDKRHSTFGTFYETGAAAGLNLGLSDPRTVTPAFPRTFFGGVRVVF
ncbi:MAG: TonB-dependent receptor [Acetobacteraceae bacterium]|nr:TonB-dependent receptor [Acetobacteraceae bacterium]